MEVTSRLRSRRRKDFCGELPLAPPKKLKRKRINYGFHSCSQIQGAHTSFHNSFGNGDLGLTGRQPVNLSWFLEAPLGLGVQFKSLHLESRNLKKNWQNFSQLLMPLNAVGGREMKHAATVFFKNKLQNKSDSAL
jgi:hypothetical protein